MRKRNLGTTGLQVSELGLGTWGLSGDGYGPVPEGEAQRVIERSVAAGVTLFETADSYGLGAMERLLGNLLGPRTHATIVTKIGTRRSTTPPQKCFDVPYLSECLDGSRERLKRDRLDVVLLHNPSQATLELGAATELLQQQVAARRLSAWGVSSGCDAVSRTALQKGAQVLEIAYNAFHFSELRALSAELRESGAGVLSRSVLAHGLLCGLWPHGKEFPAYDHRALRWSPDDLWRRISQLHALRPCLGQDLSTLRAVALRFVLAEELVSCAVLGPRNALQFDQLLREAGREPPYLPAPVLDALFARLENVGLR